MQGRRGGRPRRPWILLCRPTLGGRTRIVPASSCPSRRCAATTISFANLVRGDVVRCRYYEDGGYRVAEGAVSQIDLTFRDLWIVRRRIPFSAIQSLEMLYPAG